MNVKKKCKKVADLFLLNDKDKGSELRKTLYEIGRYFDESESIKASEVNELLELEYMLMHNKGCGKNDAEKIILQALEYSIALEYLNKEGESEKEEDEKDKIVALLINFAKNIFSFKKERDAFSSKRKGYVLDILGELSFSYDIPEALELCMICIDSKKDTLILGGLEFIDNNIDELKDLFTSEFIEKLDKIILKTKSRSVIFKALNIQVSNGNISEFEALDRLDDWKEKNYY